MLKRFIKYYRPYKVLFSLDMLASLLVSLIGIVYPIITREMLNKYIPNEQIDMVIYFGIILLVLYFIRTLLRYFIQYYGHMMGVRMQADMRKELFEKIEALPFGYFDNHETGKIMSRMTNDLMDISELAHHGPENIFMSTVMIVGSFIYLCTINIPLTLIVFSCVPFLIIIAILLRKRQKDAFMKSRKSIAKINASLESSISGIRVTKAFNNKDKELAKFEVGNVEFVNARKKAYKAMGQYSSSTTFITDLFNVIVLISGGLFLYEGSISFGDYSTFIISINLFIQPVMTLVQFMEQFLNGATGFERFIQIIDEKPEMDYEGAKDVQRLEGDIEFKNVSFKYEDSKTILNDISFKLPKGHKLALVGESGGGKTTICHLLPRFYENTGGEILIDGINIKDMTLSSLRNNIGIVEQDVFLFNTTIYENILYGNLDASYDDVVRACKASNIYDFIMSLEDGFDTVIGERGVKLSGGQRQRLSIARVFLKNPAILILDEATSALDNTTEILIQQALDELCKDRTTLVVAHRLSTINNADNILVVSDGEIAEEGNHQRLMELDGIYATLYNMQFK